MRQICNACGAVRYWGVHPPPPCPVTINGKKCPGTLLPANDDQAVDELVDTLAAARPQAVDKLFNETVPGEILIAQSKVIAGERITIARRVEGPIAEAISDEVEATLRAARDAEVFRSGAIAGHREVLDRLLSTVDEHAKVAEICGKKDGADLLRFFVSMICGEFAR